MFLFFCLSGCQKTGYRITMTTARLNYSAVQQIETILNEKSFQVATYLDDKGDITAWRERKVGFPRYPGEVYTYLSKKLGDEKYSFVQVFLTYVKNADDTVTRVEIRVENMYAGLIISEVKAETDRIGDLIYQELSNIVGKENVKIERKEVSPPAFY